MDQKTFAAIRAERIAAVTFGKAFYTYEIRNTWVDWSGTTSITHRPSGFTMTIDDAKNWAEKSRVQGSRFRIEEIPIVGVHGRSATLYLCERKSSRPMARYADVICALTTPPTLALLMDTITRKPVSGLVCHLSKGIEEVTETDGTYWRRESSPGRGFNSLGWSLKQENIDDAAIRRIATTLDSSRILCA
jgi:hypothetical protein